jgi:hypothetical protein
MTEVQKQTAISIQELLVLTLAQSDALAKLLVEKVIAQTGHSLQLMVTIIETGRRNRGGSVLYGS